MHKPLQSLKIWKTNSCVAFMVCPYNTFVYRTADKYLCAIQATRMSRYISWQVEKSEWNSILCFSEYTAIIMKVVLRRPDFPQGGGGCLVEFGIFTCFTYLQVFKLYICDCQKICTVLCFILKPLTKKKGKNKQSSNIIFRDTTKKNTCKVSDRRVKIDFDEEMC